MSKQLTNQEAFDLGLNGIRAQGYRRSLKRNMRGVGLCRYRSSNGDKCIAGHCIPDDEYHSDMEGQAIAGVMRPSSRLAPASLRDVRPDLLAEMQHAHDDHLRHGPAKFEVELKCIAARHGLTYTPPEMVEGRIVTPWFAPSVQPARPGLYETKWKDGEHYFSRFDERWRWGNVHIEDKVREPLPGYKLAEMQGWRGIYSNQEQQ